MYPQNTPCQVQLGPCIGDFTHFISDPNRATGSDAWEYDGETACSGCQCNEAGCSTGGGSTGCSSGCYDANGNCLDSCPAGGESPVIIDVNGDGFDLTSAEDGVSFDFFGTGNKLKIAWTKQGLDDSFLVLDRNGNGVIDSAKEMFGNITDQPASPEPNGFLALAVFDRKDHGGNSDGIIDANDAVFSKLRLWQDRNHDGISNPGELIRLDQVGIDYIDLRYQELRRTDQYGNVFRFRAKVGDTKRSNVGRWAYDAFLMIER